MILDNGRSALLGTEDQEMLRCIRCGACMNHCPIYHAVGGHAYGATYPGPIGAVLDPVIFGLERTRHLPMLDLLWALRKRVPDADRAAEAHATLA